MNSHHRAIRALLTTMAPTRAITYIKAFQLPEEEEAILIDCDVKQKTEICVAIERHLSVDAVKKRKRKAYQKIADFLNH
jgi:hypothetical protein